ncbi:unnamed protein product [Pieris macdunnoughi]|uniref:Uncharacterized protein n=1 Tax=Pieris macdunnoughi TaxID=345717 RepID=A0A821S8U2_9NEOP|nr:unnamed protein product [Pieris macdunnoughi]
MSCVYGRVYSPAACLSHHQQNQTATSGRVPAMSAAHYTRARAGGPGVLNDTERWIDARAPPHAPLGRGYIINLTSVAKLRDLAGHPKLRRLPAAAQPHSASQHPPPFPRVSTVSARAAFHHLACFCRSADRP